MLGAHIAMYAHLITDVSMILGCFFQSTMSVEEKASKKTCSLYLAEKVGKIQYLFSKITASGSAYHPSITGFCGFVLACRAERVCPASGLRRRIKNAGRIAKQITTLAKWRIDRLCDIGIC